MFSLVCSNYSFYVTNDISPIQTDSDGSPEKPFNFLSDLVDFISTQNFDQNDLLLINLVNNTNSGFLLTKSIAFEVPTIIT